jgi:hypothetical protein
MAGAIEETGKAVSVVVDAMRSAPMAIALLVVNVIFLGVGAYILGEVAANSAERNRTQSELIAKLVSDIRDCRQGPRQ